MRALHRLARAHGVQASFTDADRRRRRAPTESLLAVLQILGAAVERPDDASTALRDRELAQWRRPMEPVTVAWNGRPSLVEMRLPEALADASASGRIDLEDGRAREFALGDSLVGPAEGVSVHGERFVRRFFALPPLPLGYHRLALDAEGTGGTTLLIAAPSRCAPVEGRRWGTFLPLYAVRSRGNWGCGDLGDFRELLEWTGSLGGSTVGTLPLLAAFLDEPFEPSPYAPVSRLFWNELFVDVERVPEIERCAEVRDLIASAGFRTEVARARRAPLVDYGLVASLKRRALEPLARAFFAEPAGERRGRFDRFTSARADLHDYAMFRAHVERRRQGWQGWPARQRQGRLDPRDVDLEAVRYHQYVQFVVHEQLSSIAGGNEPGQGLYLDMPLGVNPEGFDTWRRREVFALGASGGSPPDAFYPGGQEWGFPPIHPENARARGHDYFIASVRHLMRQAGAMRIDHVMGLHRLFWVPPGLDARSGVYVRYPAQELYAILALESHRAGTAVVGEDLGTVPRYVRRSMAHHGVLRSYVLELEALDARNRLPDPLPGALASLDTHDMPPFASFWEGLDIEDRMARGLLDEHAAVEARRERARLTKEVAALLRKRGHLRGSAETAEALTAAHRFLAASRARMMEVNLEDLVLETEPQNRPGTGPEQPNWRRRAPFTLEAVRLDRPIRGRLEEIDRLRRTKTPDQKMNP
jgi:4-alpha-glucanotransferase